MFFATALLTEILSNNAAALIMYKIAWRVAVSLKIDAKLMAIAVMLGGSAGWMSPFGYQVGTWGGRITTVLFDAITWICIDAGSCAACSAAALFARLQARRHPDDVAGRLQ